MLYQCAALGSSMAMADLLRAFVFVCMLIIQVLRPFQVIHCFRQGVRQLPGHECCSQHDTWLAIKLQCGLSRQLEDSNKTVPESRCGELVTSGALVTHAEKLGLTKGKRMSGCSGCLARGLLCLWRCMAPSTWLEGPMLASADIHAAQIGSLRR